MEEARLAQRYGVRPVRSFEHAAAKFIIEHPHKRSLRDDIGRLKNLMPWIGSTDLDKINMGTLQPWIVHRRAAGVSVGTINHGLQVVRHILKLAAGQWIDDRGLTWLAFAPKITLFPNQDKRKPYPLTWQEQQRLFDELPSHLRAMALFAVNTGCRAGEVCKLLWDWEVEIPTLGVSLFIVPGQHVKNAEERLVVLNKTARKVVQAQRGTHPTHVFSHEGEALKTMLNTAWRKARVRAGLPTVRVHDLKHTFGCRLRAAGVSFEDRQDLLGHRSGRVTTHYSAAELSRLLAAAELVSEDQAKTPDLIVLRGALHRLPQKSRTRLAEAT
jgi:integrase